MLSSLRFISFPSFLHLHSSQATAFFFVPDDAIAVIVHLAGEVSEWDAVASSCIHTHNSTVVGVGVAKQTSKATTKSGRPQVEVGRSFEAGEGRKRLDVSSKQGSIVEIELRHTKQLQLSKAFLFFLPFSGNVKRKVMEKLNFLFLTRRKRPS